MTSLAAQLSRISSSHGASSTVDVAARGGRASLLFTSAQAADVALSTVAALAVNAFAELLRLSPTFRVFEKPLFGRAAREYDRKLHTAAENQALDSSINGFLNAVSPYLMSRAAHKTLEWLIRRFDIHEFNAEALLIAALPFHETPLFARIVSLVSFDKAKSASAFVDRWSFLLGVKKTASPLDRETLVARCLKDVSLFALVCQVGATSPSRIMTNLYVATAVACIETAQKVSEPMVLALVPHILAGLQSEENESTRAGSRIVAGALVAHAHLSHTAIAALLEALFAPLSAAASSPDLMEAIVCAVSLARSQLGTDWEFPEAALVSLLRINADEVLDAFSKLPAWCDSAPLLRPLCRLLAHLTVEQEAVRPLLSNLLTVTQLQQNETAKDVALALLSEYCTQRTHILANTTKKQQKAAVETLAETIRPLLKQLSARFPSALDLAIRDSLAGSGSSQEWLYDFIAESFASTQHVPLRAQDDATSSSNNTTLSLALIDADASVRLVALERLLKLLETNQSAEFRQFAQSVLLDRLNDEDKQVSLRVLEAGAVVAPLMPAPLLFEACTKLLHHHLHHLTKRRKSAAALADFFVQHVSTSHPTLVLPVLRLLWPHFLLDAESVEFGRVVLVSLASSPTFKTHKTTQWLSELSTFVSQNSKSLLASGPGTANMQIIEALAQGVVEQRVLGNILVDLAAVAPEHSDVAGTGQASLVLSTLVLARVVVIANTKVDSLVSLSWFNALLDSARRLSLSAITSQNLPTAPSEWMSFEDRPSVELFNALAVRDVKAHAAVSVVALLAAMRWVALLTDANKATGDHLRQIFILAAQLPLSSFLPVVQKLIAISTLSNYDARLQFLSVIFNNSSQSVRIRSRALAVLRPLIEHSTQSKDAHPTSPSNILPLVVVLSDSSPLVRRAALDCWSTLAALHEKNKQRYPTVEPAQIIVEAIVAAAEPISLDASHASSVLGDLASSHHETGPTVMQYLFDLAGKDGPSNRSALAVFRCLKRATGLDRQRLLLALPPLNQALKAVSKNTASATESAELCELIGVLLQSYTAQALVESDADKKKSKKRHSLAPSSDEAFVEPLLLALQCADALHSPNSVQYRALHRIETSLFAALPASVQQTVYSLLLDIAAVHGDTEAGMIAKRQLQRLRGVDAAVLVHEMDIFVAAVRKPAIQSPVKRPRTSVAPAVDDSARLGQDIPLPAAQTALARANVVLEVNQSPALGLVPSLLGVLDTLVTEGISWAEYTKQLCMDAVRSALESATEPVELPSDGVTVLVNCLRSATDPQTHRSALLLLAKIATLFPDAVLQHMMPVFTFMGTSVLRQDDNYSLQVIQQCITAVVPPLVAQATSSQQSDSVAQVARVFVDASVHIPEHRRMPLFTHLTETLGKDVHLYTILALLTDRRATVGDPHLAAFSLELMQSASPACQLKAGARLIALCSRVSDVPLKKRPAGPIVDISGVADAALVDPTSHSELELNQFKIHVAGLVSNLLSSRPFLNAATTIGAEHIKEAYLELLECVLVETSRRADSQASTAATPAKRPSLAGNGTPSSLAASLLTPADREKHRRTALTRLFEIVDKVNALLPLRSFLTVAQRLLSHQDSSVRRRILQVITTRADTFITKKAAAHGDDSSYVDLLADICAVLQREHEPAVNRQKALLAIEAIGRAHAKTSPDRFVAAAQCVVAAIVEITAEHEVDDEAETAAVDAVRASGFMCFASLASLLGPRVVSQLPSVMPALADCLQQATGVLQIAAAAALEALLVHLPTFLGASIGRVLAAVCHLRYAKASTSSVEEIHRIQGLRARLAVAVPARLLIPAVITLCEQESSEPNILCPLLQILSNCISGLKSDGVRTHLQRLGKFIVWSLKYRVRGHVTAVLDVEMATIRAFLALSLKLGESSFRPLLQRVVSDLIATGNQGRLSLYRLMWELAKKLRGLFSRFFALTLEDSVQVLTELHTPLSKAKDAESEEDESESDEDDELVAGTSVTGKNGDEDDDEDDDAESETASSLADADFDDILLHGRTSKKTSLTTAMAADGPAGVPTPSPKRRVPVMDHQLDLASINESLEAEDEPLLVELVLRSLYECFLHDGDGFIEKKRFELLMPVLVAQLDNGCVGSGKDAFERRIHDCVVPTIVQLALAARDDTLWRSLNTQVCLKTRDSNWRVRFAGLSTIKSLFDRLGEEYLPILPEVIPFLAELLEDENTEVEKLSQDTVKVIERYLGESLQQYF